MFKRGIIALFTVFFCVNGYAAEQDSVGVTKISGKLFLRYMVSPGETIYRISTKYKTSLSDLMDINPELEFGLKTGQIINIPYILDNSMPKISENAKNVNPNENNFSDDSLTENGVTHTIKNGETYTSISKKYNISIDELLRINKVELKTGQKIIVNQLIKAPTSAIQNTKQKEKEPKNVLNDPKPVETIQVIKEEKKVDLDNNNSDTELPLTPIEYSNQKKKLLVIPFDPYLYFSDADVEISAGSKMNPIKVRQAFRRRLNALLEPPGYETIHLLGGKAKDSITDLNRVYSSVSYSYQDVLYNANNSTQGADNKNVKNIGKEQKVNLPINIGENSRASQATDSKKYFGVRVRNNDFFTFFNNKYLIDYYVFVNQFEVKTNYENCLDRATLNYERGFTIHYSIFDKNGKQIAGNRIYVDYNSNTNQIQKILADNMQRVADRIMADLPKADSK